MKKLIVISGPTCSGKTELSLKIAKKIDGEIINADSMQVYKYLDIGTCKVKDKKQVIHHLLDIKNPDEKYSIYDYQNDANTAIFNVFKKGKIPIIVGGSGLYIQSLLNNYNLPKYDFHNKKIYNLTDEKLFEIIKDRDINLIKNIDFKNRRRLLSLVNYILSVNNNSLNKKYDFNKKYNYLGIALMPKRDKLYNSINIRTEKILNRGFIEEVQFLLDNFNITCIIKKSIGYRQIIEYLNNKSITYYNLLNSIQQATRRLAKKQITWIKNQNINYSYYTIEEFDRILEDINTFLINN